MKSGVEYLAQHPGWKTKTGRGRKASAALERVNRLACPLETLKPRDYCQMCGDRDKGSRHRAHLEPAFNPSGEAMTLCQQCRIGSAELLHERAEKSAQFVALVSRMQKEDEYEEGQAPPSEDWTSTLNELIESARKIRRHDASKQTQARA